MAHGVDSVKLNQRAKYLGHKIHKCSAVAEMGDRLATTDMAKKRESCCAPFGGGELGPLLTM